MSSILIHGLEMPRYGKCKTVTIFDDGAVCTGNSSEIVGMVDESLKYLCQRRKKVGAIPWNSKSTESRNAMIELHRIDADMYLYEIYFINLWHPALNRDDKAQDDLTIRLPEVEWNTFETPLWEKWKKEIAEADKKDAAQRQHKIDVFQKDREMRGKRRAGLITEEEYWHFYETEVLTIKG